MRFTSLGYMQNPQGQQTIVTLNTKSPQTKPQISFSTTNNTLNMCLSKLEILYISQLHYFVLIIFYIKFTFISFISKLTYITVTLQ